MERRPFDISRRGLRGFLPLPTSVSQTGVVVVRGIGAVEEIGSRSETVVEPNGPWRPLKDLGVGVGPCPWCRGNFLDGLEGGCRTFGFD